MYLHLMNTHTQIVIVGGGLAGLTSAIHLAKLDINVILIEKNEYPKHKVCGEYISNEIIPYFDFLKIHINEITDVNISKLVLSTQKGDVIQSSLPLGGFGVSRYTLDHYLFKMATKLGVQILHDQVVNIAYVDSKFRITTNTDLTFVSDYVIGAYGKRSIMDKVLHRSFNVKKSPWLAVKAHYKADIDKDTVALHNFEGGYCGISKIEEDKVNVCYLVHYDSFKRYKDIAVFQEQVLCKNPNLNHFYQNATLLFDKPITISQINFDKKNLVDDHVFMIGDAAGVIHPLCGNGMAMAIQSAQLLSTILVKNYGTQNGLSLIEIEQQYKKDWNAAFARRLQTGRILQKILLNSGLQNLSYQLASMAPSVVPRIIKQTHGTPLEVC